MYEEAASAALSEAIKEFDRFVVFGQNVAAGSRLGGLARAIRSSANCTVVNTPNSENSLVGMGFGLMASGTASMYMMKQLDFLLLGTDHLVNTWNLMRAKQPQVPFVLSAIAVDSGWEGPQSGFTAAFSLGALARIPVHYASGRLELDHAVRSSFQSGPSILLFSQRYFRSEIPEPLDDWQASVTTWGVHYRNPFAATGARLAVVSRAFTLDSAIEVVDFLRDRDVHADLLSIVRDSVECSRRLADDLLAYSGQIVLDGSKDEGLIRASLSHYDSIHPATLNLTRNDFAAWSVPSSDSLSVDYSALLTFLKNLPRQLDSAT